MKGLRPEERAWYAPVCPRHVDIIGQARLVGVVVGYVSLGLVPNVDAAFPGNGFQQGRLPGPILAHEKGNLLSKRQLYPLLQNRDVEGVETMSGIALAVDPDLDEMHAQTSPDFASVTHERDHLWPMTRPQSDPGRVPG